VISITGWSTKLC